MTMSKNTRILKVKGDWIDVLNDCRVTVRKGMKDEEPALEFKRKLLISEHSPIRSISYRWIFEDIPYFVSTHWSRHKWECFITTERSDRTGVDRKRLPQDALVNLTGDANAQQLIDTMRKRLCKGCVDPDTYQTAINLKEAIHEVDEPTSDVLVPNCIYRCGCPELTPCKFFEYFKGECLAHGIHSDNIQERYNLYNQLFWRR